MRSQSESYKTAGVDITAGYRAVELMRQHVQRTALPGVLSALGGFGGLFQLDISQTPNPVLVAGTDGVGTKLMLAFLLDKHDTIGIDCVAMCVNDIICAGAKPLFFLDYIACGKNHPEKIASIVKGIAEGCVLAECSLIGGETAEMPGFYPEEEYDLAGFSVGVADKTKLLDNTTMKAGDIVLALPSTGLHSNGFSLVRKVFALTKENTAPLHIYHQELGCTLGEALLCPTAIYVKPMLSLLEHFTVKGISHITGGGFYENLPRSLPDGLSVQLLPTLPPPNPIFAMVQKQGNIPQRDMYNTFNMGVGMAVVVPSGQADAALAHLQQTGQPAFFLGEIVPGNREVLF